MGDPRNEDDAEELPISVEQAIRAARTAAAMGRAPTPQATTKIGKYELDEALERSREDSTEGEQADETVPSSNRDPRSPT